MAHMLSELEFATLGAPSLVYVRTVKAREVMADADAAGVDISLPPDAILYAVHTANGDRFAVVDDKEVAFSMARRHDLEPVSVH